MHAVSTLVVAEKRLRGARFAAVLGATHRGEGRLEGNGCVVTWAVGHLVALACYDLTVSTFEERRRARAAWPIRRMALGEEELADPRIPESVDERIALVWTLTKQQWAFAGKEIPRYSRGEMPGRLIRRER